MNSALHTSKFKEAFHEKTFEIDIHLVSMTNICDLYLQKSLLKKIVNKYFRKIIINPYTLFQPALIRSLMQP